MYTHTHTHTRTRRNERRSLKAKSLKFQFVRKIHGAKQTGQPPFHRLSNYPWKENFLSSGARRTSRKSITRLSQPRGNIWSGSAARIGSRRFRYRNSRHVNPITKDSFQARWESETISQRWYRDERKQTEKREGDKERERERENQAFIHATIDIDVPYPSLCPGCGGSLPVDRHKTRLLHPCRLFGLDIGDEGLSTPGPCIQS